MQIASRCRFLPLFPGAILLRQHRESVQGNVIFDLKSVTSNITNYFHIVLN